MLTDRTPLSLEPQRTPSSQSAAWCRTLWLMVGVQFVMSAAQTASSPILPLFLPQLGVTGAAAVEFWTGILTALNFFVAAFAAPLWGAVADRHGRKMMVIRSSLANCALMAGMGFAQHLWELVALQALTGAFSGFSAAAIALVATQTPEDRLGCALGWLSTGQLVGSLVGPVLGGSVADVSGDMRLVFFFAAAGAILASGGALAVTEHFVPVAQPRRGAPLRGLATLAATPGLLPIFITILAAQFGVRTVQPVVTPFVQALTGPVAAFATLASFAFSITGLADLFASPFLGKRSDRIGYRRVLLIALLGAACATLPQALVSAYWQFLALRFALGMFVGGLLPTANALVGRLVPAHQRGLAYGVTASATFLGSFLGPLSGGSIAAFLGIPWVFIITGEVFLANFAWVLLMLPSTLTPAQASAGLAGAATQND
jgi:MFS transporter, DHA1 family, multidrug resistance protein